MPDAQVSSGEAPELRIRTYAYNTGRGYMSLALLMQILTRVSPSHRVYEFCTPDAELMPLSKPCQGLYGSCIPHGEVAYKLLLSGAPVERARGRAREREREGGGERERERG
jgi:hypothetical protein